MKTNDINHGPLGRWSLKLVCILDVNRIPKGTLQRCTKFPQRARLLKANCCLKVHNAHLELTSPISG